MLDRQALLLVAVALEEGNQRQPLAIRVAANQRRVGSQCGRLHRTSRGSEGCAQVRTREILQNLLKRDRVEHLLLNDGTANPAAELLATKILERLAVRGVGGEPFQALVVEQAAVYN